MNPFWRLLGYVIGLALIAAAVVIAAIGIWRLAVGLNAQLVIALVTFVGTVALAIWNFNKTKEKESEARLFPQRAAVYEQVLNVLMEMTANEDVYGPKREQNALVRLLLEAKFKMIVWGSRETLRAFDYIAEPNVDEGDMFAKVANLMGCIRRDLGHKVTLNDAIDMMLYIIRSDEKAETRSKIVDSYFYRTVLLAQFPRGKVS